MGDWASVIGSTDDFRVSRVGLGVGSGTMVADSSDLVNKGYDAGKKILAATAAGAVIGSFIPIPGVGTAVGAAIGFVVGALDRSCWTDSRLYLQHLLPRRRNGQMR